MSGQSVKRSYVGKTELTESVLENRDTGLRGGRRVGGRVDGLDDFVDLGRDEGVWVLI